MCVQGRKLLHWGTFVLVVVRKKSSNYLQIHRLKEISLIQISLLGRLFYNSFGISKW